jgi:hypothetical protein
MRDVCVFRQTSIVLFKLWTDSFGFVALVLFVVECSFVESGPSERSYALEAYPYKSLNREFYSPRIV